MSDGTDTLCRGSHHDWPYRRAFVRSTQVSRVRDLAGFLCVRRVADPCERRVGARVAGLRHAKGVASAEKNAPTAMDWDTLTDFQWGSVETDFMTIAKFSPETGNKWAEVRCGAAVES